MQDSTEHCITWDITGGSGAVQCSAVQYSTVQQCTAEDCNIVLQEAAACDGAPVPSRE